MWVKLAASWITPRSRTKPCFAGFQPMKHLDDAFALLDHAPSHYIIERSVNGTFSALVRIGGRVGKASSAEKARAICLALGQALQLDGFGASTSHPKHRPRPQDRKEPK
jgi:hypothetical protein